VLLTALLCPAQGLVAVDEDTVKVKCRSEDAALVKSSLSDAAQQYEKLTGKKVNLSVDMEDFLQCSGGVVLSALEDRILANNTLEARLQMAYDAALPKIRTTLFGAATQEIM
jgi:V-type H+-transporting ATPase subunit E